MFPTWIYRTFNFIKVTDDYVKKFIEHKMYAAILQRKEFIVRFEKFRIMINDVPRGVWKETFRPRRREFVSLRDTIYIYIYFLCSCHLRNNPLIGGLEWARKIGREGKESRGVVRIGGKAVSARRRWNFKSL